MEEGYQYERWQTEDLGVSFLKEGHKWNTEEDVADVVARIQDCPNLKYLELEGNTLGVGAAKAIGKALESKRELEAALWKDLFTGRLKNEIPQAFNYLFAGIDLAGAFLQRLDLSDNAIGPVGMVGLGPFFKSKSSFSLKELILNNNGFGPEGGSSLAEALLECLRLSKESGGPVFQLRVFVCGRNRLENKAAKRLSTFFKEVQTLEEIHMPQNGIYKEGIAALAKGIRCNKNMRVLNLNDNTIRKEGIDNLAEAISELRNLQELTLTDCLLKGAGVMQIVTALKQCNSLKKVNFSGNEIPRTNGKQAAEALRSLSQLEEVNLSSNNLGVEACEFISKLLGNVNVNVEDDEGTQDEDEESEDGGDDEESLPSEVEDTAEESKFTASKLYEDISSGEEQTFPADTKPAKLTLSALDTFLDHPSEENFLLLDKDSPFDVLKQHFSNISNKKVSFPQHCVHTAVRISVYLDEEWKNKRPVSNRLIELFMDLMSEAVSVWSPNLFTTYFLMVSGVFKANFEDCSTVIKLKDLTLHCLSKWLYERKVPRNVAFYFAVIGREFMKERRANIDVTEARLDVFLKASESAYNISLKQKSETTIPVPVK